jgi:thioesterase domain-containing protein
VLDIVRTHLASILGHGTSDDIAPDIGLPELGLDSVTALTLRNRLKAVTGLRLPATVVFDHPSPSALAEYLDGLLTTAEPAAEVDQEEDAPYDPNSLDSVPAIYQRLTEADEPDKAWDFLHIISQLRDRFDSAADLPRPHNLVRLCRGAADPAVVCFTAPVALVGAGTNGYARFANAFRGRRDVWGLNPPGFGTGEPLASGIDVLTEVFVAAIRREIADVGRVVLLGVSSGGWLAQATAAHLEREGQTPAGVVLVDTYSPTAMTTGAGKHFGRVVNRGVFERQATFGVMNGTRLTAMNWYQRMFGGYWRPTDIEPPTLLVRATDHYSVEAGTPAEVEAGPEPSEEDWRATWDREHTVVDVPGDHWSLMEGDVTTTAEAVERWIREL